MYVILLSDILIWCKIKKANIRCTKSLKCICILPLHKCKARLDSGGNIIISCDNEDYIFSHNDPNQCKHWYKFISEALLQAVVNRQSLRKKSSAKRAAFKKDVLLYHNPGLSPDKKRKKRQVSEERDYVSLDTFVA